MPKSYTDWQKQIKKEIPPIVALCGEEHAFLEDAITHVRMQALASGLSDFNHDVLLGKQIDVAKLLTYANALPMMAPLRLVEVKEAEGLNVEEIAAFSAYLASPCASTVLLLRYDRFEAKNALQKALDAQGLLYKFDHPPAHQMANLAVRRAQRLGLSLSEEVAQALVLEVGQNLLMLDRALEKLALVTQTISAEQVAEYISPTGAQDAFALARWVALGDRKRAEKCMAQLKMAHEIPLKLLGTIAWQLRQVLRASILLEAGVSEQEIGRRLAMFGDRLVPVLTAARSWRKEIHVLRLSRLCQLDKELKSSRAPAWLCFERTIMQLCRSQSRQVKT